jgi:hypothetical protein
MMTALPPSNSPRFRELAAGRTPLLVAGGAILVGLCLLLLFAALLLRGNGAVLDGEEPTPFPTPELAGPAAMDVIVGGIAGGTPISLSVNAPTTLEIGAQSFAVRAEAIGADGTWEPELGQDQSAVWVYGTLINYVLGLPDNGNNRTLLEGLAPGANISWCCAMARAMPLPSPAARRWRPTGLTSSPRICRASRWCCCRRAADERLVVRGDYVVDTAASSGAMPGAGNQVSLGETAQLDNMRLNVTGATSLFDRPEAPPGFIFYLIDLQLENIGTEAIDLASFASRCAMISATSTP